MTTTPDTPCCPGCHRVELLLALERDVRQLGAQLQVMSDHVGVELVPAPGALGRYLELLHADQVTDPPLQLDLDTALPPRPRDRFSVG